METLKILTLCDRLRSCRTVTAAVVPTMLLGIAAGLSGCTNDLQQKGDLTPPPGAAAAGDQSLSPGGGGPAQSGQPQQMKPMTGKAAAMARMRGAKAPGAPGNTGP